MAKAMKKGKCEDSPTFTQQDSVSHSGSGGTVCTKPKETRNLCPERGPLWAHAKEEQVQLSTEHDAKIQGLCHQCGSDLKT